MMSFLKAVGLVLCAGVIVLLFIASLYAGVFILVLIGVGIVIYCLTKLFNYASEDVGEDPGDD